MINIKKEAKVLIEKLPDDVSWDDIIYEFYVKKKISEGLQAAEEGRILQHDDVKKRLFSK